MSPKTNCNNRNNNKSHSTNQRWSHWVVRNRLVQVNEAPKNPFEAQINERILCKKTNEKLNKTIFFKRTHIYLCFFFFLFYAFACLREERDKLWEKKRKLSSGNRHEVVQCMHKYVKEKKIYELLIGCFYHFICHNKNN